MYRLTNFEINTRIKIVQYFGGKKSPTDNQTKNSKIICEQCM